ncbi:uncharacterized protein LOC131858946 [Cryptomeria japonica]|uniref:uncharacterized protein LOC131858946 n=1 Tax=Cryptomeria japonica TaxID=3369 RepID=UPI0027DA1E52|nr:uncharacterized protein LOC131858946 [Cryptomeria japonica]
MALVYKVLKGRSIEKPIKGKYARDEDMESEASGFNFDSETEGDSEETSQKGRNEAKRKRIVVDSDISESEAESFEGKFIKKKKGKVTGKKMQRKKTSKESNKDISQILIDSEEETEENKKDEGQGKEGEENPVTSNIEGLNTQGMQKEEQEDKSGKLSDCVGENATIKGFCETVGTMVKEIGSLKKDMMTVKRATVGEKPLTENVKELAVAINNAKAIESKVGKIIATKKKVKEMEENKEVKGMETAMNNLESHRERTNQHKKVIPAPKTANEKKGEIKQVWRKTEENRTMDWHCAFNAQEVNIVVDKDSTEVKNDIANTESIEQLVENIEVGIQAEQTEKIVHTEKRLDNAINTGSVDVSIVKPTETEIPAVDNTEISIVDNIEKPTEKLVGT